MQTDVWLPVTMETHNQRLQFAVEWDILFVRCLYTGQTVDPVHWVSESAASESDGLMQRVPVIEF